jgi:hypothetical protein
MSHPFWKVHDLPGQALVAISCSEMIDDIDSGLNGRECDI